MRIIWEAGKIAWEVTNVVWEGTESLEESLTTTIISLVDLAETTGTNRDGSWVSPIYDLGSTKTVRIWGNFSIIFAAEENTWEAVFPEGRSWSFSGVNRTWNDIFGLTNIVSGGVSAKLEYGETAALGSEITHFEVLAPEITARYVRLTVTLRNPSEQGSIMLQELTLTAAYWE